MYNSQSSFQKNKSVKGLESLRIVDFGSSPKTSSKGDELTSMKSTENMLNPSLNRIMGERKSLAERLSRKS